MWIMYIVTVDLELCKQLAGEAVYNVCTYMYSVQYILVWFSGILPVDGTVNMGGYN